MNRASRNDRPNRRKGATALAGAALLLGLPLLATACTESPEALPAPETTPAEPVTLSVVSDGDGKNAVVVKEGSAANRVEDPETVTSTLDVGKGSCYYLTTEGKPDLLVFPSGTSLEGGDTPSVVLDGERFPDGTLIAVTGQRVMLSPENLDQAKPCLATAGAFLVTSATGAQEPESSASSSS